MPERHLAFCQEAQGPAVPAGRRGTAGERNEVGFLAPVQLRERAAGEFLPVQRGGPPAGAEAVPGATHRREAHVKGRHQGRIGPGRAVWPRIGFEKQARLSERAGRRGALLEHLVQRRAFCRRKGDTILLGHRWVPPPQ